MDSRFCGRTVMFRTRVAVSRRQIQQPTRSAYQHLASIRRHDRHAVADDDKAKLDEAFDEIGLRKATVRHRVAKRLQNLPLVRRKIEVDVVAHVASSRGAVRAPLLEALHEDRATTMSREFDEASRTSLHKLLHAIAPQALRSLDHDYRPGPQSHIDDVSLMLVRELPRCTGSAAVSFRVAICTEIMRRRVRDSVMLSTRNGFTRQEWSA